MGCFGINGGISKLPIVYKDKCVLIFGLILSRGNKRRLMNFGVSDDFTPISLPIYGIYNDYGVIEDVVKDRNVQLIEEYFGYDIETIIKVIDDNLSRNLNKEKYYNLISKLDIDDSKYELGLLIEHEFIYDSIIKMNMEIYNWTKCREITNSFPFSFKELQETEEYKKIIESYKLNKETEENLKYSMIFQLIERKEKFTIEIVNINPNYKLGIYQISAYFNTSIFMHLYKDDNAKILLTEIGEKYEDFLQFYFTLSALDWNLNMHNYSGQNGVEHLCQLKTYYENILGYINNKIKEYDY